jgi:hypothetical protein
MLEFSIITISSFVTILDETVKTISQQVFKKDVKKFLPLLSVIFGIGLGIIGFYTPGVDMGNNLVEAVFIGLAAGSAATGVHQITKQLNKKDTPEVQLNPFDLSQFIKDQTEVTDEEDEANPYGVSTVLLNTTVTEKPVEEEKKETEEK